MTVVVVEKDPPSRTIHNYHKLSSLLEKDVLEKDLSDKDCLYIIIIVIGEGLYYCDIIIVVMGKGRIGQEMFV